MSDYCSLEIVSQQQVWQDFFEEPCKTINDFETIITDKLTDFNLPITKKNINKIGAIIVRDCIIDKLTLLSNSNSGEDKTALLKKIEYYGSEDFIKNFSDSMPIKTDDTKTQYASYFDTLFNTVANSDDDETWRNKINRYPDQSQCMRALNVTGQTVVAYQNSSSPTTCYLCNRGISKTSDNQNTMECEHILPVTCALSHWWLIKYPEEQNLTQSQLDELSKEYKWSHKCCNKIKTNSEFIIYDSNSGEYRFNRDLAKIMLNEIDSSTTYDCDVAKHAFGNIDINTQLTNIQNTVKPMLDKINENLEKVSSYDMYELICKFKIISAMNEKTFASVISDNSAELRALQIRIAKSKRSNDTRKRNQATNIADANKKKEDDTAAKTKAINSRNSRINSRNSRRIQRTNKPTPRERRKDKVKEYNKAKRYEKFSVNRNKPSPMITTTPPFDVRKENTPTPDGMQEGGALNYSVLELLKIAGFEKIAGTNIIDDSFKNDINEKFDDLFKDFKYTIFKKNPKGAAVKHKMFIYSEDNPEETMAQAMMAKYSKQKWSIKPKSMTRRNIFDVPTTIVAGIKNKKGTIRKNRQKKKRQKRKKSTNKKRRGKTKYTKKIKIL